MKNYTEANAWLLRFQARNAFPHPFKWPNNLIQDFNCQQSKCVFFLFSKYFVLALYLFFVIVFQSNSITFFHAYLNIRFEKARNSCMHVFQKFYNITYIYINHFRIFVVSVDRALSFCWWVHVSTFPSSGNSILNVLSRFGWMIYSCLHFTFVFSPYKLVGCGLMSVKFLFPEG